MPEQDIDQQQQNDQQQGQDGQQSVIDWESESNPYKKRYSDSQGQVTPLVSTLKSFAEYDHSTKTWKPKTQAVNPPQGGDDDVEKLLEGYDPDFRKNLKVYTQRQIDSALNKFNERNTFVESYNKGVTSARDKCIKEFGSDYEYAKDGKFNPASPLYKLADEILTTKYAQFQPDGTFYRYTTPDAEYLATVEAYAIITKRAAQGNVQGKTKLGAIQGKGTSGAGGKKGLSYEEYSKLSDSEKDAYDMGQVG